MKAIDFLETVFHKGKPLTQYLVKQFPLQFVPGSTKRYLYAKERQPPKRLLPNRYEFLVYRQLRNGIESGDIFCRDSVRFRSFEDDLIDNQQWQQKAALITATGLSILNQPIQEHLAKLERLLEERIVAVNQRISAGENEHIKITQRNHQRRWTLPYPGGKEPINHPFYDTLQQEEIGDVLHFVNQQCHFMEAFDHVLGRYVKQEQDNRILFACLVAWATNRWPKSQISNTIPWLRSQIISSGWRPSKRPMTLSAMPPPPCLSSPTTNWAMSFILVSMGRSLIPAPIPSMRGIHRNTLG
jgi:hypothetical protein